MDAPVVPQGGRNVNNNTDDVSESVRPGTLMVAFAAVFVGGVLGSLLRSVLPSLPLAVAGSYLLPNAMACLIIGGLYAARHRLHAHMVAFGITGFCGGLSTFSGLAHEWATALSTGALAHALGTICLEVTVGLGLVWVGERLTLQWLTRAE